MHTNIVFALYRTNGLQLDRSKEDMSTIYWHIKLAIQTAEGTLNQEPSSM
jgi:hypothetical protein